MWIPYRVYFAEMPSKNCSRKYLLIDQSLYLNRTFFGNSKFWTLIYISSLGVCTADTGSEINTLPIYLWGGYVVAVAASCHA